MSVVQTGIPGVEADDQGNLKVVEQFVDLTGLAPSSAVVGIVSAEVVAANASRKGLVLLNLSKKRISFGLEGAAAVLGDGITLLGGGVYTMDKATLSQGAVTAIGEAVDLDLGIQEFE